VVIGLRIKVLCTFFGGLTARNEDLLIANSLSIATFTHQLPRPTGEWRIVGQILPSPLGVVDWGLECKEEPGELPGSEGVSRLDRLEGCSEQ